MWHVVVGENFTADVSFEVKYFSFQMCSSICSGEVSVVDVLWIIRNSHLEVRLSTREGDSLQTSRRRFNFQAKNK